MAGLRQTVRANILGYMASSGIDQAELSRRCRLSPAAISRFLNEDRVPNLDSIEKIAVGLRVPAFLLLMPTEDGEHTDLLRLWRATDGMPDSERRRIIEDVELRRAYIENPDLLRKARKPSEKR